MSFPRSPATAVWLLAAAGAYSVGAAWADDAQAGKVHPWVLVAVFWGAALLSVAVHHLLEYLAHALPRARAARFWSRLRRQAGRLADGEEMLETAVLLAGQGWDTTRRVCEQQMAHARRAPGAVTGALIGWSRSALRALRA